MIINDILGKKYDINIYIRLIRILEFIGLTKYTNRRTFFNLFLFFKNKFKKNKVETKKRFFPL